MPDTIDSVEKDIAEKDSSKDSIKGPIFDRISAQINEERVFRELTSVQMSRIKLLDDLLAAVKDSPHRSEVLTILEENLQENPESIVSRYILGSVELSEERRDRTNYMRRLLSDFIGAAKWAIVDHIADAILEKDEKSRIALRAKVESSERLRGKKELRPFLERLAQIDRKNPDIARKYGLSLLEEDQEKALTYLKQAGETYARLKNYKELEAIWQLVVRYDHTDMLFFERIERIVAANREKTWIAAQFVSLVEPFRSEENWPKVIHILKKILYYEPESSRARSDLVRAYRAHYKDHSLLNEFLKMSELTNHKKAVEPCIIDFERNIVFDRENYVYHRSRGVGKVKEMDKDQMIVDFAGNSDQRMSIQMAISSLQPLQPDHIWVRYYENQEEVREIFEQDITLFFEALLSSFGNRMSLAAMKQEIAGRFIPADQWSKWWSRARTQLKKDPRFSFDPRKKDNLLLRETPMTFAEELSLRFQSESDWNKRLELAVTALKDPDTEDAALVAIQFYRENETNRDTLKRLHSYLMLELASAAMDEDIQNRHLNKEMIQQLIEEASAEKLGQWSENSPAVEIKKELVNLIIQYRKDYAEILKKILLEIPIRIHRYVINELIRLQQEEVLRSFLSHLFRKYREHPEIFLWAARSILSEQWNYPWVEKKKEDVLLLVFRLLKPLANIEKKGTKLKNMAIETIAGSTHVTVGSLKKSDILMNIIRTADLDMLRRMYVLFCDTPYLPEAHEENFYALLREIRPDFEMEKEEAEEEEEEQEPSLYPSQGIILVSANAFDDRRRYLERLVNVDMPANSRDIGIAQEKGDLRENAEYKAALERQSQLQHEIMSVSQEIKKTRLIEPSNVDTNQVTIGTRVMIRQQKSRESRVYTILGPWDVNMEQNIISYESPLAKALIGKKPGEEAVLDSQRYRVEKISSALN